MGKLKDSVSIKPEPESKTKVGVFKSNTSKAGKDKGFSGKINSELWDKFSRINQANGVSNNSAINLLIANFVRDHRNILEEEY